MAGGFRSIGVALGLDTTGLQRGFNQGLNQLDKFLAQVRTRLQSGGLRGFSRLLGPGAAIYGAYEIYKVATEKANEFLKKQQEIQSKLAETAKQDAGTPLFQKDIENLEKFDYQIDATTAKVLAAQGEMKSIWDGTVDGASTVLASVYSVFKLVHDASFTASMLVRGASKEETRAAVDENSSEQQAAELKQDQKLQGLFGDGSNGYGGQIAEINKARKTKQDEADRKLSEAQKKLQDADAENAEKKKSALAQLQDNQSSLLALENKTGSVGNYEDSEKGRQQRLDDYAEQTRLKEKNIELTKQLQEADAKDAHELQRAKDLKEQSAIADGKSLSLTQEQAAVEQDLADVQAQLLNTQGMTQEQINDLTEKHIELENKDNEILSRKMQLMDELTDIQQRLNDMQDKQLEALSPSDADLLRKGGGGSADARAKAQEAQRKQKEAARLYREYQDNKRISEDPSKTEDERNSALYNMQRLDPGNAKSPTAKAIAAQRAAEEASGSKEGIAMQQEDRRVAELQKRAGDINDKISGKQAPPLTGPEFTKAIGDLKTSIDKMSAKLDPQAAVTH